MEACGVGYWIISSIQFPLAVIFTSWILYNRESQQNMPSKKQGASSRLNYDPCLVDAVTKTNILVMEGYLFELPDTVLTISKVCEKASKNGALVAITASDVSCIERYYDDCWEIMANYADIVFANSEEARTLSFFIKRKSPFCYKVSKMKEMKKEVMKKLTLLKGDDCPK